jgi:pimeloyl-ACP methyl ester carboxylesterase
LPGAVRVFYPSLDARPKGARIVEKCERFPLVLFIHGQCQGDSRHYLQWVDLPAALARSGYVVTVSSLGGVEAWSENGAQAALQLAQIIAWMRGHWVHRDRLMPEPNTAFVGHSYGATLAIALAGSVPGRAVVSLSGIIGEWPPSPAPALSAIGMPSLFTWGRGDDADAGGLIPTTGPGGTLDPEAPRILWRSVPIPKHAAVFDSVGHWEYLTPEHAAACDPRPGFRPCGFVPNLASDLVTAFMTRYVPPELAVTVPSHVPDDLYLPLAALPPSQAAYGGSFLSGFSAVKRSANRGPDACWTEVVWETSSSSKGSSFLLPNG